MRVGEHDRASRRRQHTRLLARSAPPRPTGRQERTKNDVQPAPKWYLLAARVSERVLACFFFPDAFGTAGSSRFPGSVLHPGRSLAPQARLNPAFRTLLALQARLDLAFRTLLAPPARSILLSGRFSRRRRAGSTRMSLPQFPDAFGAAGSSRSLSQTLLAPRARLDPPFWTLLAPQARLDPAFWTLLF